jgi:chromosome segregation ATPase
MLDRIEALTAKVKLMDDLDVINGEKIEALTEQLEAARADAKEAEAYAEELEKEIELNEQEACMLEDDFIKADKEIDDIKAKLAKAVEALRAFKAFDDMPTKYKRPDVFEVSVRRKLLATLAEIEGEKE